MDKLCKDCGERPRAPRRGVCRECHNARQRERSRAHPSYQRSKELAQARLDRGESKWCPRCETVKSLTEFGLTQPYCKPCRSAYHREMAHKQDPLYKQDYDIRKKYGISLADRDELLEAQGNRCAICLTTDPGRSWHIDHDHVTGKVRGILCFGCNVGLGVFQDDESRMRRAIRYLKQNKEAA